MQDFLLHFGEDFQSERKFWEPCIQQWVQLLEDYASVISEPDKPDQGYWDNERANLGFFVLALHKAEARGILQEFSTKRTYPEGDSWGRCDLYCYYNKKDYYFEAKKISFSIGFRNIDTSTLRKSLNDYLDQAKKQLRKIKEARERKSQRVAILFAVPYQSNRSWEKNKQAIDGCSNALIDMYRKPNFIIAKYIPPQQLVPKQDGYRYPGVFLIFEYLD